MKTINITKKEQNALQSIIRYLYIDEYKHYLESSKKTKEYHIFNDINILKKLLNKINKL